MTRKFFARLRYKVVDRADAPKAIALTKQFAKLCPASAKVMVKEFRGVRPSGGDAPSPGAQDSAPPSPARLSYSPIFRLNGLSPSAARSAAEGEQWRKTSCVNPITKSGREEGGSDLLGANIV